MSAHGPLAGEARHRPLCPILGGQRTARALAEPFGSWPRCGHSQTPDGAMSRVRSTVSMPAGRDHWAPMSRTWPHVVALPLKRRP